MPSLVLQIQQTARLFDRMLDPLTVELGVRTADLPVLLLAVHRNGVTVGQLRESFGYPASSLATILARLERAGYVRRYRVAQDGRVVVVRATLPGETAGKVALARIDEVERRIAKRVGVRAVAGCLLVLEATRLTRRKDRWD